MLIGDPDISKMQHFSKALFLNLLTKTIRVDSLLN